MNSWCSDLPGPILSAVHRFARTIAFLFIAAQLLLAVPAGASVAGGSPAAATDCADMHPASAEENCPCCPDGTDSMTDCMSACALALSLPTSLPICAADEVAELVRQPPIESVSSLADPPLKPPPII